MVKKLKETICFKLVCPISVMDNISDGNLSIKRVSLQALLLEMASRPQVTQWVFQK